MTQMHNISRTGHSFISFHLKKINFIKIIFILFLLGMIYGALLMGLSDEQTLNALSFLTEQFVNKRAEQSIIITFFSSFSSSILLLLALFLVGFCAIGQPFALFIPVFHGLGLGMSMAYMYATQGLQGVLFSILLILPQAAISTFAIILGTRESVRFSNMFFHYFMPDKYESPQTGALKLYLTKFAVLTGFIALSALVDSICTFLFAGFFH